MVVRESGNEPRPRKLISVKSSRVVASSRRSSNDSNRNREATGLRFAALRLIHRVCLVTMLFLLLRSDGQRGPTKGWYRYNRNLPASQADFPRFSATPDATPLMSDRLISRPKGSPLAVLRVSSTKRSEKARSDQELYYQLSPRYS